MKKSIFIAIFLSGFLVGCAVKDENYNFKSKNNITQSSEQKEALKINDKQNIQPSTKEESKENIKLGPKEEIENKELIEDEIEQKEADIKKLEQEETEKTTDQNNMKDIKEAENLKSNCENGSKESCLQYGNYLYGKDDFIGAASVYNATCSHFQYVQACIKLAGMFENGVGVEKNIATAKDIYTRACYSGNSFGCKKMKSLK